MIVLKQSFIIFEEEVYSSKQGIPTGNCISRQIATSTKRTMGDLRIIFAYKKHEAIKH